MASFDFDMEVPSPIPATRFFKAFVLDYDKLIPKVVPQYFKSIDVVEGDGGVGSIKHITYGEASEYEFVKIKIEAIDSENLVLSYTVIDSDGLKGKYEKVYNTLQFVATSDGGSIYKTHTKHFPVAGYEIKEDEIKFGKEKAKGLLKAIETYLLANPNEY